MLYIGSYGKTFCIKSLQKLQKLQIYFLFVKRQAKQNRLSDRKHSSLC